MSQLPIGRALLFSIALAPFEALARAGGGESYFGGGDSGGGDGGGIPGALVEALLYLLIRNPRVGVPVILICIVGYIIIQRNGPTHRTQRAFQEREAAERTEVSLSDVEQWVTALQATDPDFDRRRLLQQARSLFEKVQSAWMTGDLLPVRPSLSDATYQRLNVLLALIARQGVRDAVADLSLRDTELIGLSQTPWFDTVLVRITAQARDTEVPAGTSLEEATAAARKARLEAFTEVWSLVRKPGARTRTDGAQGSCPQCGAPFSGGATNNCEYCGAVVNSGSFDWVLAEITQGSEHVAFSREVEGLSAARESDPGLSLETLEDRASLVFWKWIDAQSANEATRIAKLASPAMRETLQAELDELQRRGRRKVFLECAVGAVRVRSFDREGELDRAHVEVRWSARLEAGPTVPRRSMLCLVRRAGAQTPVDEGMSTDRCLQCHAPPGDSASSHCDHCGVELSSGDRQWVLAKVASFEEWFSGAQPAFTPARDAVTDRHERERLLYLMAAVARADGELEARERRLLKQCAERWSVPFANLELALQAGPELVDRLLEKGSPEAEALLRELVQLALIDGRVDRKERRLLETVAAHLKVEDRLEPLLRS